MSDDFVCSGSDDDDMSDEGTDDTLNNTSRERTGEQAHRFTFKNIFENSKLHSNEAYKSEQL